MTTMLFILSQVITSLVFVGSTNDINDDGLSLKPVDSTFKPETL